MKKTKLVLVSAFMLICATTANAQSKWVPDNVPSRIFIPLPADSASGGIRLGEVSVVPTILPSNLCTGNNGNCYSASAPPPGGLSRAEVQAMIDAANLGGGSSKAWTIAFAGQQKCVSNYNGGFGGSSCAQIQPSGDIAIPGASTIPAPGVDGIASGNPHSVCMGFHDGGCSAGWTIAMSTVTPVKDSSGKVIGWSFDYGLGAYDPSGI